MLRVFLKILYDLVSIALQAGFKYSFTPALKSPACLELYNLALFFISIHNLCILAAKALGESEHMQNIPKKHKPSFKHPHYRIQNE